MNISNPLTGTPLPLEPDLSDLSELPAPESELIGSHEDEPSVEPDRGDLLRQKSRLKMVLNNLSQTELDRAVFLLVTNGPMPHVQEIIAPVGFGPEGLQLLADLLHDWRVNQTTTEMTLLAQKQARQDRDAVRKQVAQIASSFKRTARAVFRNEEKVLRFLGIRLPRKRNGSSQANGTNGSAEATTSRSSKESQSIAACLVRWRKLFGNAQLLDEMYKQRLAEAGWNAERLAEAVALVEALATGDSQQEEAMAAHTTQKGLTKQAELTLRVDYKEARELIRVAIDESDVKDKEQFKEFIGLAD